MRLITLLVISILILASRFPVYAQAIGDTTTSKYEVIVSIDAQEIEANKPFDLTLTVVIAVEKTPIESFDEVHTKLLHLIMVSEDLTQFLHLHPDYMGAGVFKLSEVILPQTTNYVVFADFTPTGDTQQVVRKVLTMPQADVSQAHLHRSSREVTVGELTIHLTGDVFAASAETSLSFHVTNAATGEDIHELDEYLGAAGHLVIIDPSTENYIHTHPANHDVIDMNSMHDGASATHDINGMAMTAGYGPHLEFIASFPITGLWSVWLQVQYKGEIYTFPYVLEVTSTAEVTPSAHSHG